MILEKGKNVAVQQKPAIVCYLGTYIGVIKGLGTYTVNDEKMGQTRPLMIYFRLFLNSLTLMLHKTINGKKSRFCSWDSNPGPHGGRCR